jgi:hypothetical protein
MRSGPPSLEATLARISNRCLRGHAVPAVLRLLWQAQMANDPVFSLFASDTFLEALCEPGRAADNLGIDERTEGRARRAYLRLFEEVGFLGCGGAPNVLLFGYWFHEPTTPETAPVLVIDSEGQFGVAPTLQDYLASGAGEHDPANGLRVRQWFAERGVAAPPSPEALPDPAARLARYFDEAAGPVH